MGTVELNELGTWERTAAGSGVVLIPAPWTNMCHIVLVSSNLEVCVCVCVVINSGQSGVCVSVRDVSEPAQGGS